MAKTDINFIIHTDPKTLKVKEVTVVKNGETTSYKGKKALSLIKSTVKDVDALAVWLKYHK